MLVFSASPWNSDHMLWWGCLTWPVITTTWIQQNLINQCKTAAWYSVWKAKERWPLLHVCSLCQRSDIHLINIHLVTDRSISSLFKATRVRPETVTWGRRLVRPTVATFQHYTAAKCGSITGFDYWKIKQEPSGEEPRGALPLMSETEISGWWIQMCFKYSIQLSVFSS